jgi:hypothetical protein
VEGRVLPDDSTISLPAPTEGVAGTLATAIAFAHTVLRA